MSPDVKVPGYPWGECQACSSSYGGGEGENRGIAEVSNQEGGHPAISTYPRGLCAEKRGEASVSHPSTSPFPLCSGEPPWWGAGIVLFLAEGTLGWQVEGHLCTVTQGTTRQPSPPDFSGLFCACTQRELFLP